ncbi:hypothetical protein CS022_22980 [Veronia nyctiphanis]|uniref:DUF898 domain-containing protein n=1 Tax=Veronia nyctiphanis TaxID=1278244 RepID=A0A4Q0YMJ2_9GAMM|nr:YjgN family protein [Veronia nyctiphanis]RXJ70549.1 hypothetical protein CS022_22980 [Veronia nyctiphanis]
MQNRLAFHGRAGEFFGIWIVNIVLSVITLGIYSAWAKVRTKKYFYGNTELAGDRFDYHATPIQILIGRVIAFALFVTWIIVQNVSVTWTMIGLGAFLLALPLLARNNARFDARMTSYRNVRFNFTGSLVGAYIALLLRPLLLPAFLAGIFYLSSLMGNIGIVFGGVCALVALVVGNAWIAQGTTSYFANGYLYGEQKFNADITTGFFIKTYLLAALLSLGLLLVVGLTVFLLFSGAAMALFALFATGDTSAEGLNAAAVVGFFAIYGLFFLWGLIVASFVAVRTRNYVFGQMHTQGEESFQLGSEMTTGQYVWLTVSNFFAQVVTLGLARPWVLVRTTRYLASVTTVTGNMEALRVHDTADNADSALGDEVSQAFGVEIGLN